MRFLKKDTVRTLLVFAGSAFFFAIVLVMAMHYSSGIRSNSVFAMEIKPY